MKMTTLAQSLILVAASAVATVAMAEKPTKALVQELLQSQNITEIQDSPMPGWVYAIADGNVVYVSNDSRYMIYGGEVWDLEKQDALSNSLMGGYNQAILESIPVENMIVYHPDGDQPAKASVTVFTDPNCGYCRKLHSEMAEYQAAGIEVRYAATDAFGGAKSTPTLKAAWCMEDRQKGMDLMKSSGNLPAAPADCDTSIVDQQIQASTALGIRGTPAIFDNATGEQIGGYLSASDMLARLSGK